MSQLLVRFAWMPSAPFRLDHSDDLPVRLVKAIIGDAVPRLGVVAIDRNLKANLRAVLKAPPCLPQLRVDKAGARERFT
jgi:hypothetical protein